MPRLLTLLTLALLAILAACSSSDNGGGTAIESGEPDESSLREAMTAYIDALQNEEFLTAYSLLHQSYKDKCESGEFVGQFFILDAFLGESWRDAELRIESVSIDGTRGTTVHDLYLDGRPLGFTGDEGEYWTHDDGRWWAANDEPDPCGTES